MGLFNFLGLIETVWVFGGNTPRQKGLHIDWYFFFSRRGLIKCDTGETWYDWLRAKRHTSANRLDSPLVLSVQNG